MVVVADAGKRQQLVAIGDRHRADVQLLDQHLGHLHAILFVESLRRIPSVDAATFSAVAEKAEVYFSNIARLSSRMRINSAAPTVLVTIIGAAMLCTRCRAS